MSVQTHCKHCTGQLGIEDRACQYCGAPVEGLQPVVQNAQVSVQPFVVQDIAAPPKTNSMATASLVVSCVGWLFNFLGVTPIAGIILGSVALRQIKNTGEAGRGSAIAGIIISAVNLVFVLVVVILVILFIESLQTMF